MTQDVAHVCGAILTHASTHGTGCWWCGKDIRLAVPATDAMQAARVLGGLEAVRVILRTIPELAAEVPIEVMGNVEGLMIPVVPDVRVPPGQIVIINPK